MQSRGVVKTGNLSVPPPQHLPGWLPLAALRHHATMLMISAIGGVRMIANPPRAVGGDPHPGCKSTIRAIVAGAISDKPRPIRPALDRGGGIHRIWRGRNPARLSGAGAALVAQALPTDEMNPAKGDLCPPPAPGVHHSARRRHGGVPAYGSPGSCVGKFPGEATAEAGRFSDVECELAPAPK